MADAHDGPSLTDALEQLHRSLETFRTDGTPDSVHAMRVSLRRLDVWLRLAGLRVLRDDLRWLRRAAGAARDLDVLLANELPAGFAEWLAPQRPAAAGALIAALDAPRASALLRALPLLPNFSTSAARDQLQRLTRQARAARQDFLARPDDVPRLHHLRRALRRVRYGRAWLGRSPDGLVEAQTLLGRANDATTALTWLLRWPAADTEPAFVEDRQAALVRHLETAVRAMAKEVDLS